jgi:peptidoglycan L-alanyl-D-glutamate endopeptidase CwlK
MASRQIKDLNVKMQNRAEGVVRDCRTKGVDLLIYCTYRSPEEQARLYRQSRTLMEIEYKADVFRERGFEFLSNILIGVGPQNGFLGRHVTYAGPGESWHQYRMALDAVPLVDGKCMWGKFVIGTKNIRPEWLTYGKAVKKNGLYWAGDWKNFQEFPHCQEYPGSNPLKTLEPGIVESALGFSFGQRKLF